MAECSPRAGAMVRWLMLLVVALACLGGAPVRAATPGEADAAGPEAEMQQITDEVLAILRQDTQIRQGDTRRAAQLIEEKVAPHFDFERMTRLAVGRAWSRASPDERKTLEAQFRILLVRTYANSLTAYSGQTLRFKPSGPAEGDDRVVRSVVTQPGKQPIPITYAVHRTDAGWRVYDVTVADISLVTTYRSHFASIVSERGVAGLIRELQEKNRRPVTEPPPGAAAVR